MRVAILAFLFLVALPSAAETIILYTPAGKETYLEASLLDCKPLYVSFRTKAGFIVEYSGSYKVVH